MQRDREMSVISKLPYTTPNAHPRLQPLMRQRTGVRRYVQTWYALTFVTHICCANCSMRERTR